MKDFRPPWIYVWARLVSFAVIPATGIYSVFFYDFGDREHVFSPVRRWASTKMNLLFPLSPTEERLLQQQRDTQADGTSRG